MRRGDAHGALPLTSAQQACKLGCEGIVSKRVGSLYRSGRSKHWIIVKNPAAPTVRREAEGAGQRGMMLTVRENESLTVLGNVPPVLRVPPAAR